MLFSFVNYKDKIVNQEYLELLIKTSSVTFFEHTEYYFLKLDKKIFDEEFISWLKSKNCNIGSCELWKIQANTSVFWHTDFNPPLDFAKFLIPWNSKEIVLEWGEVDDSMFINKSGVHGHSYQSVDDSLVNVTERVVIDKPIIINPGILHRALNTTNQDYYSLNFTLLDENNNRMSFLEGTQRLMSML